MHVCNLIVSLSRPASMRNGMARFALITALLAMISVMWGQDTAQPASPSSAIRPTEATAPTATVADAVRVGIPVPPSLVQATANSISVNGRGGYSACASDEMKYLDSCKMPAAATAPVLKVPMTGYKLSLSDGKLVPIPVTGPNSVLQVRVPTNGPNTPSVVLAVSPLAAGAKTVTASSTTAPDPTR
jgi:hypothetical protein